MDSKKLKLMLQRDIERLKTLDVDILDSKLFYMETFKYTAMSFFFFFADFIVCASLPVIMSGNIPNPTSITTAVFASVLLFLHMIAFVTFGNFVLLRNCILKKLESGEYITHTIFFIVKVVLVFVLCATVISSILFYLYGDSHNYSELTPNSADVFVMFTVIFPTIFFKNVITTVMLNRLGVSAFFSMLQSIVNKKRGWEVAGHGKE